MGPNPNLEYKKVELLISVDDDDLSTFKVEYENAYVSFVSHFLIIQTYSDAKNSSVLTGKVFDLNMINSYKLTA
jgi:hypothetical protein